MVLPMGSPTSTAVKICGLTNIDQARAIAALGVDAIGVIGVANSPRFIKEQQRRDLFAELNNYKPELQRVWVVADINASELSEALQGEGSPSVVQLHGQETPEYCANLRLQHPKTKWWKALRLRSQEDLHLAQTYARQVDALLLDAWQPGQLGGTGHRLPLNWLNQTSLELPWWLAGGVCAEWIPELMSQLRPWGVDASSRLEISPGIKDLKLVEALVQAVHKYQG